jgi:hypothetical protein
MHAKRNLCRGWTASKIRQAVLDASERQQSLLAQIAANPGITSKEIADNLDLLSPRSVGSTMAAWSRVTKPLGVVDPADGKPSWPMTFSRRPDGFWRYEMPAEVRDVVLDALGQT